jgi:hypothetical protein
MKKERGRRHRHPVPHQEFERLMRDIRGQVRDCPHQALEEIFLHLDWIENKYDLWGSEIDEPA